MAETETSAFRDRDVDNFSRDETLVRLETVSRPRPQPWAVLHVCTLQLCVVLADVIRSRSRSLYVVARPSVCLSSVVCLSVTFVRQYVYTIS